MEALLATYPDAPLHLVRVIEERPVSDYIAAKTGVTHESPQLIVLRQGTVRWHASHGGVTAGAIATHIG